MIRQTKPMVILLDSMRPGLIPAAEILGLAGVLAPDDDIDARTCDALSKLIIPGDVVIRVTYSRVGIPADTQIITADDPVSEAIMTMRTALKIGQWEQQQTHQTLIRYLNEEVAEFIEAIEHGEPDEQLRLELGDILLQVLFHAEIAARRGAFDFYDVAAGFVNKLKIRAPYLFDGTTEIVPIDRQKELWQQGKQQL